MSEPITGRVLTPEERAVLDDAGVDLSGRVSSAGPRIEADRYTVYPTGYDDLVNSDKDSWCLTVSNGHAWGWRIAQGRGSQSPMAMNKRGEFIYESRGSGHNKARRWPLDEALRMAAQHVDTHRINGCTAVQASADVAARLTRADYAGTTSCGIAWAEEHLGPLVPLDPAYLWGKP